MSEREFTTQILRLARLYGWMCVHFRPARTLRGWRTAIEGDAGYPDLTLCHGRRGLLITAELKVGRRQPTPEQTAWSAALAAAGVPCYLWYADTDWDTIESVLKGEDGGI